MVYISQKLLMRKEVKKIILESEEEGIDIDKIMCDILIKMGVSEIAVIEWIHILTRGHKIYKKTDGRYIWVG